jgi:phosphoglycolate phosphatase
MSVADRPFDLVLFDLDGTLIDSAPQLALAVNRTLAELGLAEPTRPWYLVGNGADKLIQRARLPRRPGAVCQGPPLFDRHYQACLLEGWPWRRSGPEPAPSAGAGLPAGRGDQQTESLRAAHSGGLGIGDCFALWLGATACPSRNRARSRCCTPATSWVSARPAP